MAWVKVPKENHPIFRAALPAQPRSTIMPMFGGLAATVNGNIACGLFGRSVMVRLGDAERAEALALDGASPFDPMGTGAVRGDKVMLPESVMDDRDELRAWLQRALDHAATLPKKAAKKARPAGRTRKA
ncbi:MAG TPA: TfoX/Sxy family protein [Kofleriaceae bacterium]|nr:TfoX/Sxy family protein [Kofleriaceae bacterium]